MKLNGLFVGDVYGKRTKWFSGVEGVRLAVIAQSQI